MQSPRTVDSWSKVSGPLISYSPAIPRAAVWLDDSVMFAERAKAAGVDVKLDVFSEMLHSFQMAAGRAPEADDALSRLGSWARPLLGLAPKR
jgi:acetyl esterase/lipase